MVEKVKRRWAGILCDDPGCAYALGTLRDQELALLLDGLIDVIAFVSTVWYIVVSYVVDLVLFEKFWSDDPGTVGKNLVHPFAMSDCLCSLSTGKHCQTFALVGLGIPSHANEEIGVWERSLCLFELAHVAVEKLVDTCDRVNPSECKAHPR